MSTVLERVAEGSDNILASGQILSLFQILTHGLACDGHSVAVDQLVLQQVLEDG